MRDVSPATSKILLCLSEAVGILLMGSPGNFSVVLMLVNLKCCSKVLQPRRVIVIKSLFFIILEAGKSGIRGLPWVGFGADCQIFMVSNVVETE